MMKRLFFAGLAISTLGCATMSAKQSQTALIQPATIMTMNEHAPAQLAHMNNMMGNWAIKDWNLQDGEWTEGTGADWDFYYTLDGYAIEDIWIQPPRSVAVDDENQRTVGVNLRKYDPQAGKWVMSWMTKAPGGVQTFSATSDENEVVMLEDEFNAQGVIRRITFYNMTGDSFDWRAEISQDGETWREVYRIKGTRKE